MQQIEVDAVGLEPLQAALAGGDGAGARGILRQHLADDEALVAPPLDGLGDDPPRRSPSPYISAVSISVMPRSSPSLSAAISSSRRRAALAHAPGALAELRHGLAGGELERLGCWTPPWEA